MARLTSYHEDFLPTLQRFVAFAAIGPSALRNQGASGVIGAAREFLGGLDLSSFAVATGAEFGAVLDAATESLESRFPKRARHWGAARKAVNLFLRDSLNNRYIEERHHLSRAEPWMEIPLDKVVAGRLKERDRSDDLSPWPGLKRLTMSVSDEYQAFACELAKQRGLARVHLDMYLWLEGKQNEAR